MAAKCGPLTDLERAAGARLTDWFGHQLAADYGQWIIEYNLLRTGSALSVLPGMGLVRVAGRDARDYLHRRLTAAICHLAPNAGTRAALLTGEGRMLADLLVLCLGGEEFLLLTAPASAPTLAAHVERYIFREDCSVEDRSALYAVMSVDGPATAERFSHIAPGAVGCHAPLTGHPEAALVVRADSLGLMGFYIVAREDKAPSVWETIRRQAGGLCGLTAREAVRIEAGMPLFGADMNETTIPLEAGLETVINFDKGCFPGQEIVARIKNLGHPARRLVGLRLDGDEQVPAGTEVFAGDATAGRLTSSAWSPALGAAVGLATVKWALRTPGTLLSVAGRRATVCTLPMVP